MEKCIVITGGNSGMGFETVKALASAGHRVIFTTRSAEKGKETLDKVRQAVPKALVETVEMDLEDLASVRHGAHQIRLLTKVIDVLILNAGIMTPPWGHTVDGYERQFQANYLGHFFLFQLVEDLVLASHDKRVISVSSLSSEKGTASSVPDFQQISTVVEEDYHAMTSYRESKLAQVLFTKALRHHFAARGLTAYAVHPGVANTNLFYRGSSPLGKALMQPLAWLGYLTGAIVTPQRGARTVIALAREAVSGEALYWANRKPRAANPLVDRQGLTGEPSLAEALWAWSISLFSHVHPLR
jgi:NAD(P)-dependent dehydrogenase (short-subunit alcohol dehydrogenase family)